MFDEKVDVAGIMAQIKLEAQQRMEMEELAPSALLSSDRTYRETLVQISRLTQTIQETGAELHDSRNVGGLVPAYERFPVPIRQLFRLFSRIMRKGMQFAIQDQVDVNTLVDTILSAVAEKEELMMQLLLRLEGKVQRLEASAPDSDRPEETDENTH